MQLGIGLISPNEALASPAPADRAMAGMLSVFAEFEREILRERVKAGIRRQEPEGDRSCVYRRRRKRRRKGGDYLMKTLGTQRDSAFYLGGPSDDPIRLTTFDLWCS